MWKRLMNLFKREEPVSAGKLNLAIGMIVHRDGWTCSSYNRWIDKNRIYSLRSISNK